jgi:hypothetical protein
MILAAVVNLQHAYRVENEVFYPCGPTKNENGGAFTDDWREIGMAENPYSRFYNFTVDSEDIEKKFDAIAGLYVSLDKAQAKYAALEINEKDVRTVTGRDADALRVLVPNWR